MYALGKEAGKIVIEKEKKLYKLTVVGDSRSACAPRGYIALTATLYVDKQKCELGKEG
jgi:hypothetical protein